MIETLCPPALIYICFSLTQIIIDTFKGLYTVAFFKFWVMIIFTLLLNILCDQGLGIISWIIVFIPFMLMSVITMILIFAFGLDPETGSIMNVNKGGKGNRKKGKGNRKKGKDNDDSDNDDSDNDDSDNDDSNNDSDNGKKKHNNGKKKHHNGKKKHHDDKLKAGCKRIGCSIMPNNDDGNCHDIQKENGYCYKQCFMKCSNYEESSSKCNFDSDCSICPAQKIKVPCHDMISDVPTKPGSTSIEKFMENMSKFNTRV